MNVARKVDSVSFSSKGQVVIPAWLRRQFQIENGTRAVVEATPEGILVRPVTATAIRRLRGIVKRKPGGPSFAEEWSDHKRDERALEEGGHAAGAGSR